MNMSKKENCPAIKENEILQSTRPSSKLETTKRINEWVDQSIKQPEIKSVHESEKETVQEKSVKDSDFFSKLKESEGENFYIFKSSEEVKKIPKYSPKTLHHSTETTNIPAMVRKFCDGEGDSLKKRVAEPVIERFEQKKERIPSLLEKLLLHLVLSIVIVALLYLLDDGGNFAKDIELIKEIWCTKPIVVESAPKSYFEIFILNSLYYLKKLVNF